MDRQIEHKRAQQSPSLLADSWFGSRSPILGEVIYALLGWKKP
jgi:hypothetical protein